MHKAALLVAVLLAVALSTMSNVAVAADPTMEANKDAHHFVRDALNPYMASGGHHRHHMHHWHHMHHRHHHHRHHGKM